MSPNDDSSLPSDSSPAPSPDGIGALFEEYLERRDSHPSPETADLYERANDTAAELERRIRFYEEIRRTADLMHAPGESSEGDDSHLLDSLKNYKNHQRIGRGGQARVYKSYDSVLGRDVALKLLRLERVAGDEVDRLLQAEAQALGRLTRSCIVTVHAFDNSGDVPYMVMEYVLAPNLREVFDSILCKPPLINDPRPDAEERNALLRDATVALAPLPARMRFLAKLAEALEYCHSEGVLHRDIKPENILVALVDGDFVPRLVDFGLSFSERKEEKPLGLSDRFLVTLAYSAPEQLAEERLGSSPKAEQFSLGTVAYEFLTGRHPFDAQGEERGQVGVTRTNVLQAEPEPMRQVAPKISGDLAAIVNHAHELNPEDRYARIGDFAKDLDALLEFRSLSIQHKTVWGELLMFLRRNRSRIVRWSLGALFILFVPTVFIAGGARLTRDRLESDLWALEQKATGWDNSWDFEPGWKKFAELDARSRDLDAEFIGSLIVGQSAPAAERCRIILSTEMHDAIEANVKRRDRFGEDSAAAKSQILQQWKTSLALEQSHREGPIATGEQAQNISSSPFQDYEQEHALVLQQVAPKDFPFLSDYYPRDPRESPGRGNYRFLSWDRPDAPMPAYELDISIPTFNFPDLVRFDPSRLSAMTLVPEFEEDFFNTGEGEQDGVLIAAEKYPHPVRGPSFYVSPLITWAELDEAVPPPREVQGWAENLKKHLKSTNSELFLPSAFRGDSPALVGPKLAMKYATTVGARLPNIPELFYAYQHSILDPSKVPENAEGEGTSTVNPVFEMFHYVRPGEISLITPHKAVSMVDTGSTHSNLVFRIARTHATKAQLESR